MLFLTGLNVLNSLHTKPKTMKNEMGKLVQKGIIAAVTNKLLQEEQKRN